MCDGHCCGKILSYGTDAVTSPNFVICEKCLVTGEAGVAAFPIVKLTCAPSDDCACDICKVHASCFHPNCCECSLNGGVLPRVKD